MAGSVRSRIKFFGNCILRTSCKYLSIYDFAGSAAPHAIFSIPLFCRTRHTYPDTKPIPKVFGTKDLKMLTHSLHTPADGIIIFTLNISKNNYHQQATSLTTIQRLKKLQSPAVGHSTSFAGRYYSKIILIVQANKKTDSISAFNPKEQ